MIFADFSWLSSGEMIKENIQHVNKIITRRCIWFNGRFLKLINDTIFIV